MDAALDQSLASAANLIRDLTPSAQQQIVKAWVTSLRREPPLALEAQGTDPVNPEDTWARFVASGLPVEAGALPGCVTHPSLWGDHVDQLCAAEAPEHGYIPGRCSASSARPTPFPFPSESG